MKFFKFIILGAFGKKIVQHNYMYCSVVGPTPADRNPPPPSSRHSGPLADWWPPLFNQQISHICGSRPQIRDPELCVYVGAVEYVGGSDLQRGIMVMGVCLRRFCLNMKVVGDICLF